MVNGNHTNNLLLPRRNNKSIDLNHSYGKDIKDNSYILNEENSINTNNFQK